MGWHRERDRKGERRVRRGAGEGVALFGCYIVSLPIHLLSWYGIYVHIYVTVSMCMLCVCKCIVYVCASACVSVFVCLSFWGYANCYADIIINSSGKQAGNKLGFEWVIVFCGMLHFCGSSRIFSPLFLLHHPQTGSRVKYFVHSHKASWWFASSYSVASRFNEFYSIRFCWLPGSINFFWFTLFLFIIFLVPSLHSFCPA